MRDCLVDSFPLRGINKREVARHTMPAKKSAKPSAKTEAQKAGLTDQQWNLIDHYFTPEVKFNKTEACRRAGYANPDKQCGRLFGNKKIVREIERRRRRLAEHFKVGPQEVLAELSKIGFLNVHDFGEPNAQGYYHIDLKSMTREQKAAIAEIKPVYEKGVQVGQMVKFHDKIAALDKLARNLGLFNDSLKLEGDEDFAQMIIAAKRRVKAEQE